MTQKQFEKAIKKFDGIETARDEFWEMALGLIRKGFEIEAYILILATWNFAGFRYTLKDFDLNNFRSTVEEIRPIFDKFEGKKFLDLDFDDVEMLDDIKFIYSKLKHHVKQTGATKIMALKNPEFFIMWDTKIRKMYKIKNSASADDYISFLRKMKNDFAYIEWTNKDVPLAKAIDEYNYVVTNQKS